MASSPHFIICSHRRLASRTYSLCDPLSGCQVDSIFSRRRSHHHIPRILSSTHRETRFVPRTKMVAIGRDRGRANSSSSHFLRTSSGDPPLHTDVCVSSLPASSGAAAAFHRHSIASVLSQRTSFRHSIPTCSTLRSHDRSPNHRSQLIWCLADYCHVDRQFGLLIALIIYTPECCFPSSHVSRASVPPSFLTLTLTRSLYHLVSDLC